MKYFFRHVFTSLKRRFLFDKLLSKRNRSRLHRAVINHTELVDVMPGINMPMVIHPEMYFKNNYIGNVFEPDTIFFMKDSIAKGDVIFDVGANIGYFSLLFSKLVLSQVSSFG